MNDEKKEVWAVIELMGHDVTAGILCPSEIGGLMKVDVPIDDSDKFKTEFIGPGAVFRIKVVSEEIARVYARSERGIVSNDEPIVSRSEYENALQAARKQVDEKNSQIRILQQRLSRLAALPIPEEQQDEDDNPY